MVLLVKGLSFDQGMASAMSLLVEALVGVLLLWGRGLGGLLGGR